MANQSLLARGTAGPRSVSDFRFPIAECLETYAQRASSIYSGAPPVKQGTGELIRLLLPMMKAERRVHKTAGRG